MSEIKIYKLLSGEELIGYYDGKGTTEDYVTLDKVHVLAPQQTPDGKIVLMFAPWLISAMGEGKVKIYWTSISGEPHKVPDQLATGFRNQTSMIQQPTAQEKSAILVGR